MNICRKKAKNHSTKATQINLIKERKLSGSHIIGDSLLLVITWWCHKSIQNFRSNMRLTTEQNEPALTKINKMQYQVYISIGVGVRVPVRVRIGYFGFSGISVQRSRTRSGISVLRVGFGYFQFGFGYFGSGSDIQILKKKLKFSFLKFVVFKNITFS